MFVPHAIILGRISGGLMIDRSINVFENILLIRKGPNSPQVLF